MKNILINTLIVISFTILGCSNKDYNLSSNIVHSENVSNIEQKKFWVNSSSNVIHNSSCRWYNNTKRGYYSDNCIGKNCGICGGCK